MRRRLNTYGQRCWGNSISFSQRCQLVAEIDPNDPHTVNVGYPAAFSIAYIRPQVRLEIGPLASWVPSSARIILVLRCGGIPGKPLTIPICVVVAIRDAERTFGKRPYSSPRGAPRSDPGPVFAALL